jgi:N-acetylglucosamine-6-phosphate deacetylase
MAEVIADGVHVAPAALRLLARAKGTERTLLVTDAVSATGMRPGQYALGGMEIMLGDDARTGLPCCRTHEGALAGSVLTQDRAVRNMVAMAGVSLLDAVRMASYNPAWLLGIEGRKGSLRAGADADVVVLNPDGTLYGAMAQGRASFL